ncbi:MAG: hypothetical protein NW226_13555 [Microscillaceae bacterium]|nr:hypothetical protein [Microscillaceae bacterium]
MKAKSDTINPLLETEIALFKTSNKDLIIVNYVNKKERIIFLEFKENDFYLEMADTWREKRINDVLMDNNLFINSFTDNRYFFKLPEYGTTILACPDERDFIEDPEAFWQDKLQNAPEEIIRLNWQDGKFVIESPTPKRQSGGGGMPIVSQEMALDTEDIPQIPTFLSPSGKIFAQAIPVNYRSPLHTKPPGSRTWTLNPKLFLLPPDGAAKASLHFNYEGFEVESDFFNVWISPATDAWYRLILEKTIIFKLVHPFQGYTFATFQLPQDHYFVNEEDMH